MNKFQIISIPDTDPEQPVLYKLLIGTKYYLHKGKILKDSAERFLDDVFRGMRNKKCPEEYSNVVEYCLKFPSIHRIALEVVLNGPPAKILAKEKALYKKIVKDRESLNRADIAPYTPEWMIRQTMQERCEKCIPSGVVAGKKVVFKFCPNCGRLNK